MNKILLIIKREYITRVRNKTFLLSTFLLPIVMMLFIFGSAFFAMSSKDKLKKIAVVNDPGYFRQNLQSDSARLNFNFNTAIDSSNFESKGYDAVLDLNNDSLGKKFTIHSIKQLGIDTKDAVEDRLDKAYEEHSLQMIYLNVEPKFDPIRSDPRFLDLERRIGLHTSADVVKADGY